METGGRPRPGDVERDSLVGIRSAPTAISKELGALELELLERTACGSSSWELLWLRGSLKSVTDERLLPTGVLLREIQTPSTSMPLSMARIPNGTSSLVSSRCASNISGVCTCLPFSTLEYLAMRYRSYCNLTRPIKTVKTW